VVGSIAVEVDLASRRIGGGLLKRWGKELLDASGE